MQINKITCPHCGNSKIEEIELRIERPSLLYHPLYKDEKGGIHGKDQAIDDYDVDSLTEEELKDKTEPDSNGDRCIISLWDE